MDLDGAPSTRGRSGGYGLSWDTDGHCLAATTAGLEFWNGVSWTTVRLGGQDSLRHARVVERCGPGEWLIASERGGFSVYSGSGVREVVHAPIPVQAVHCASGVPTDLMVGGVKTDQGTLALLSMAARRWMRPLPLTGISGISSLARLDDDRSLLCGRTTAGAGFAAIYEPMQWALHMLPTPRTRAFVTASSQPERGIAIIGGAGGVAARFDAAGLTPSALHRPLDIAASGIDVMDDEWVAGAGWVCLRRPGQPHWESVWENASWTVPFVSILADVGLVVAMTADGGVLEGRASWRRADAPRFRASRSP
jgi:hypothetical protein